MARRTVFNSVLVPFRPCPRSRTTVLSPFKPCYSTQPPTPPIDANTLRYAGWALKALVLVGGYGIGVSYNRYRKKAAPLDTNAEDPDAPSWSTFTLQSRQNISPTVSIFTLKSTDPILPETYYDKFFDSSIFAVDIGQPQIQIVREYTPLPPALDPETGKLLVANDCAELHLLIRKEPRGEVSGYVHALLEGAQVKISNPRAQARLEKVGGDREVKNLLLVVGGTGITAAMQAVHAVLESRSAGKVIDEQSKPYVHILWANRRREDCLGGVSDTPLDAGTWAKLGGLLGWSQGTQVAQTELGVSPVVDELRRLKSMHGERLKVDYFVDEEDTFITTDAVQRALAAKPEGKSYIAVSGPEGFMVNFAGDKRMLKNRITTRPVSGTLAGLKQDNWELMVLG